MPDGAANARTVSPVYRNPVPLCGDAHRHYGLLPRHSCRNAAGNTAIPLGVGEFFAAARHYPIVFSPGPQPMPFMLTGLADQRNRFLDERGVWRTDAYLPLFLRRYPFVLGQGGEPGSAVMFIDQSSERLVDARTHRRALRLFTDAGEPTASMQEAASLCLTMYQEELRTAAFSRALQEAGLLAASHFRMPPGSAQTQIVDGFCCIDEKIYRALPGETLLQWQSLGWLDAVAFHLASQMNWQSLVTLQA